MSIHKCDVLFFGSPGGHLDQLIDIIQVIDTDNCALVVDKPVEIHPENCKVGVFVISEGRGLGRLKNVFEVGILFFALRPRVLISTGASPAVYFFLFSKFLNCKSIFVESLARVSSLSKTGKLVKPLATKFFVQWETLASVTNTEFRGRCKVKG